MNRFASAAVLAVSVAAFKHIDPDLPCDREPKVPVVTKPGKPLLQVSADTLPTEFDWRNKDGVNYLTNIWNQHLPQYCGSCWAVSAASVVSDRIKIMRNAAWPDFEISPQPLISCEKTDYGCEGGSTITAFEWMKDNEITERTTSIYLGRGHTNGQDCSAMIMARDCHPGEACFVPDSYYVYGVAAFDWITPTTGQTIVDAMKNELYQRGPIACSIHADQAFDDYTSGVFCSDTVYESTNHAISLVGWGVEDGQEYWLLRNSWGTWWGENGFAKLCTGQNTILIESKCSWATPLDTWTNPVKHQTTEAEKNDPANDQTVYTFPQDTYQLQTGEKMEPEAQGFLNENAGGCRVEKAVFPDGEVITGPLPWERHDVTALPATVDWRAGGTMGDGKNYLSWNKNQHIPQYCGSCWSQGSTSAIADRFNIYNYSQNWTPIGIDAQQVINAQAGGSCNGGNPTQVYKYAHDMGLVHSSCEQYVAHNLETAYSAFDECRDCTGPAPQEGDDGMANCYAVTPNERYYVTDYYAVKGADQMKTALQDGPISCGVHADEAFEAYTGGIFSEEVRFPLINHEISVVGYSVDETTGQEYWIGRNSWGNYWGIYGFFYMQMYSDNLGIENDCLAGHVSFYKPSATSAQEFTQ